VACVIPFERNCLLFYSFFRFSKLSSLAEVTMQTSIDYQPTRKTDTPSTLRCDGVHYTGAFLKVKANSRGSVEDLKQHTVIWKLAVLPVSQTTSAVSCPRFCR